MIKKPIKEIKNAILSNDYTYIEQNIKNRMIVKIFLEELNKKSKNLLLKFSEIDSLINITYEDNLFYKDFSKTNCKDDNKPLINIKKFLKDLNKHYKITKNLINNSNKNNFLMNIKKYYLKRIEDLANYNDAKNEVLLFKNTLGNYSSSLLKIKNINNFYIDEHIKTINLIKFKLLKNMNFKSNSKIPNYTLKTNKLNPKKRKRVSDSMGFDNFFYDTNIKNKYRKIDLDRNTKLKRSL